MKKILLLVIVIVSLSVNTKAQCSGCTMTINSNSSAAYALTSTDVLCITGGLFSGTITAFPFGAKICVSANAQFNPLSMPATSAGTIIISTGGTAILPAVTTANGFDVENYGTITFQGALTLSGISTFNNYDGCSMTIQPNFTLATVGSSITNRGTISFSGNYTGNNSTNVYNYGYFSVAGTFSSGSSLKNYGKISVTGNASFTAGVGSLFHNYCTFISNGNITNLNTTSILQNYGYIIATTSGTTISNGNNTPTRPNWYQTATGITVGVNFSNFGNVNGQGNYYFSGVTTNAAGSTFGTDALVINFFDSGLPTNIMDVQTVAPHASVTKVSFTPPTSADQTSTCNISANKGPLAADDFYITSQDENVFGNVFSNDIDPENNTLTLGATLVASPTHYLAFNLQPNGDFNYTPTAGYYGTDMFVYSVCDNGTPSKCDTASVSITINEEPVPMPSCDNPGSDPSTTLGTVPNTYYPGTTANLTAGSTSLTIGAHLTGDAGSAIAIGDKLMIIQIQGSEFNSSNNDSYGDGVLGGFGNGILYTTANNAGVYEFATAASNVPISGGTLNLQGPLVYSYVNAAFGTQGQKRYQIIKVPQYTNLQITANITVPAWNGSAGGIFCISVSNTLDLNGYTISVKGKGFRGGGGDGGAVGGGADNDYRTLASIDNNGSKGEGIAGTPRWLNNGGATVFDNTAEGYPNGSKGQGAPGNAGGGGTDGDSDGVNQMNTGGGGGGNGGAGGKGGNAWSSAEPFGGEPGGQFMAANANRLVFGGGGGAASTNNNTGIPGLGFASSGAPGGGMVIVYADRVINNGTFDARGDDANNTVLNDASGGGGAGGSVLLVSNNSLTSVIVLSSGGKGGNNYPGGTVGNHSIGAPHGPGGGGGGGAVFSTSSVNYASAVRGGSNGLTTGPIAYGSTSGNNGVVKATVKKSELAPGFLGCFNHVVASNDNNITFIDIPVSGNILSNDFDAESDNVSLSGIYNPATNSYINNNSFTVEGTSLDGSTASNAGSITIAANGDYTFTPAAGFTGAVDLAYKITDNYSYQAAAYAKLKIHIIDECDDVNNLNPFNDNIVTYMNEPVSLNVLANDIDPQSDSILFNGFINPDNSKNFLLNGSISIGGKDRFGDNYAYAGQFGYGDNGTFTFTPVSHFTGAININYEVCDNNVNQVCKKANLKISVEPIRTITQNHYPYANDNAALTYMDVPINGSSLLANTDDANTGDVLSVNTTPVQNVSNGTLTINGDATYLYTPNAGYTGQDYFIYEVCDNASTPACSQGIVYISVINSEAKITQQPVIQNICTNANAGYSVIATGTNLTYQWQQSTDNGNTWGNISNGGVFSNATTFALAITGAPVSMNNYNYRCALTTNCNTVYTDTVMLVVGSAAVSVTVQPVNNSVCNASVVSFSVSATGPDLTYQWQESINNGTSWNNLSNTAMYNNVNTAELQVTGAVLSMDNYRYRCVVSSSCAAGATSSSAVLNVGAVAASVINNPENTTACSGTDAIFTVYATGSSLTYQWQENQGSGWNNLTASSLYQNITNDTLILHGISSSMNTFQYRCIVSSGCAAGATSSGAALTVNATPTIINTTQGTRCGNGSETLFATASAGTINWYTSFTVGSPVGTGTSYATPDILSSTYYYVDATDNGCRTPFRANILAAVMSDLATIISNPSDVAVCAGTYQDFSVIASTNTTGYQWQYSSDGGSNYTNIIDNSLYSGSVTSTLTVKGVSSAMHNYRYRCVATASCKPDAVSSAAVLTVNTSPLIVNQPVNSGVCAGSNTSFSVTASGTVSAYQWQLFQLYLRIYSNTRMSHDSL